MRFLMTQSLLASWQYQWSDFEKYGEKAEEFQEKAEKDFLSILRRERIPTNEDMQRGIDFEKLVTDICFGCRAVENSWYEAAKEIACDVKGGQFQLVATKNVSVAGLDFLLYGRIDCLKAGVISDIKFSGSYTVGKFFESPQHPMYMELVPEAELFTYIVSNGNRVWRETYRREECRSVLDIIQEFVDYLREKKLFSLYKSFWKAKETNK